MSKLFRYLYSLTNENQERKVSNHLKELFKKNRTERKIEHINKYVTPKQVNKIYHEIKEQFPPEFSKQTIKEIIKIQQAFTKDANEHGCVINLTSGEIFNPRDGEESNVHISYSGVNDKKNLASIHNHPIHGFNAPSDTDIDNMLHNPHEKYCIVLSENKIWIVKNKYYNVDLSKTEDRMVFMDCINIVEDIGTIYDQNKYDDLVNLKSLENINTKLDKEINRVFEKHNFYSQLICI